MKLKIYRDGNPMGSDFLEIEVIDAKVSRTLMGKDEISFKVESETSIDVPLGAVLSESIGKYRRYTMNDLPVYDKQSSSLHVYDFVFQSPVSDLEKVSFFDVDGEADFSFNGKASDFIGLIISNLSRASTNSDIKSIWIAATSDETAYKTIQFQGVTCWAALNLIADEFDLEFEVGLSGTSQTLKLVKTVGNTKAVTLGYGKTGGLYNLKRSNVSNEKLVTRLYYRGSDRNLPVDYAYTRLRGTTNYIEDAAKIAAYGVREGIKNFDEIKPSYTGTVTGYGFAAGSFGTEYRVYDSAVPFDIFEKDETGNPIYIIPGTTAKMNFLTGDCAGHTFDIRDFKASSDRFIIAPYVSEAGYKIPNNTVQPAAGDQFVIFDILMPAEYVDLAVASLDAAALAHYATVSTPMVAYTLESYVKYFAGNNISLDLGDKIAINDPDISITETCRVIDLSYPLFDTAKVSIKLSDVRFAVPGRSEALRKRQMKIITDANQLTSAERLLKNKRTTGEVMSMVFANDQFFTPENNRPESLDPYMQALDSGEIQFSLKSVSINPNEGSDPNVVGISSGQIIHHSFNAKTRGEIQKLKDNSEVYDPTRTWTINVGTLTLANNNSHFLYAKLPLADGATTATIIADENHLWAKSEDGYILYKIGEVKAVVDGSRLLNTLWGEVGHKMEWTISGHTGTANYTPCFSATGKAALSKVQLTEMGSVNLPVGETYQINGQQITSLNLADVATMSEGYVPVRSTTGFVNSGIRQNGKYIGINRLGRAMMDIYNDSTATGDLPAGLSSRAYALVLSSNAAVADSRPGIVQYVYRTAGGIVTTSLFDVFTGTSEANAWRAGTIGVYAGDPDTTDNGRYIYLDARIDGAYNKATLKIDALNRVGVNILSNDRPNYRLEVQNTSTSGTVALFGYNGTRGLYISPVSTGTVYLQTNSTYDGASFTAKYTNAAVIAMTGSFIAFRGNTGLTEGGTFTPTEWGRFDVNGVTAIGAKFTGSAVVGRAWICVNVDGSGAWTALPAQVYPGAGIAVSTGTAWGTSITDNSANWNTAHDRSHIQLKKTQLQYDALTEEERNNGTWYFVY